MSIDLEIANFVLDDARYDDLLAKIETAKKETKAEVIRKPPRSSGILEKDMRQMLQVAESAYACEEWGDAGRVYLELTGHKAGPKSIIARLSLCHVFFGDVKSAYETALVAFDEVPGESAAYLTMAMIKMKMRLVEDSARWLELAERSLHPHLHHIEDLKAELETLSMLRTYHGVDIAME
jgi:hypothetical protein